VIDLVIFDLDGTLIDSHLDIYRCAVMAFEASGLPGVTIEELEALGGAPLHVYHAEFRPPAPYDEFLATYRSLQDIHGLDTTRRYPGVRQMLRSLDGVPRAVASTKPTSRVVQHATAMGLAPYFDHLQGTDQPPYKPDPAVLNLVLSRFDASPARTWMVGDLVSDVQAGRNAGVRTLGVTYSGTTKEEFEAAGADETAETVGEVGEILGRWIVGRRT